MKAELSKLLENIKPTQINNKLLESIDANTLERKLISEELADTLLRGYSPRVKKQAESFNGRVKKGYRRTLSRAIYRQINDFVIDPVNSNKHDKLLRKSGWYFNLSHLIEVGQLGHKYGFGLEAAMGGLLHDEPEIICERDPNKGIIEVVFGYKRRNPNLAKARINDVMKDPKNYQKINPHFNAQLLADNVTRVTRFEESDYLMDMSSMFETDVEILKKDFQKIINKKLSIESSIDAPTIKITDRIPNSKTTFPDVLNPIFSNANYISMEDLTQRLPLNRNSFGYYPNGDSFEDLNKKKFNTLRIIEKTLSEKGFSSLEAFLRTQEHLRPSFLVEKYKRNIEFLTLLNSHISWIQSQFNFFNDETVELYSEKLMILEDARKRLINDSVFYNKKIIEFYQILPDVDLIDSNRLFLETKLEKNWHNLYKHQTHESTRSNYDGFFKRNLQNVDRERVDNLSTPELVEYFTHEYRIFEEFKENNSFTYPEISLKRKDGSGGYAPIDAKEVEEKLDEELII